MAKIFLSIYVSTSCDLHETCLFVHYVILPCLVFILCSSLATPNPRTYIGSGKVAEIKSAIHAFGVETVIFDDELSPGLVPRLDICFTNEYASC